MPISSVKTAQAAFLADLEKKHAKLTSELQKGEKATDEMKKNILNAAQSVAGQYKAVTKETK